MNCQAIEMNNSVKFKKRSDAPILAGNFRLLLGFLLALAGLYIATLSDFQGHGLGFLFVFSAPFIIFKDDK